MRSSSEDLPEIKIICAWCGAVMKDGDADKVSHGICDDCFAKIMPKKVLEGPAE